MKSVIRFISLVAGVLIFIPLNYVHGQCLNMNFGMANFTNWDCYAGSCANGVTINPSQPLSGRHTIMGMAQYPWGGTDYDEHCTAISKVPSGFVYSCRIGNSAAGAEMDAIEYTLTVDNTNTLLLVHFAYVLQYDQSHTPDQQARFSIMIRDSSGNLVGIPCDSISYVATSNTTNLNCQGNLAAKNWTQIGYDLSAFIGQTIKVYFETRDCTQSEHFGYAYVTAECRPLKIDVQFCAVQSAAQFRAPEGFSYYKWTRSSNPAWVYEGSGRTYQNYTCTDPVYDELFTCVLTSELVPACTTTVQAVIKKTSIFADFKYGIMNANGEVEYDARGGGIPFNWYDTCSRTVTFVDLSSVVNSRKQSITWEIKGINVVSHDSLFTYTFPHVSVPTDYTVRLTVEAENGCVDTSSGYTEYHITIHPSPKIAIEGITEICRENKVAVLVAKEIDSALMNYVWSWVDGMGGLQTATGDSLLIFKPGTYKVAAETASGCTVRETHTVTEIRLQLQNLLITDVECFGETTGGFHHGIILGGQAPYLSSFWHFPDELTTRPCNPSGGQFLNLKAGTYVVEAVDAVGCRAFGEVVITEPSLLEIDSTASEMKEGILKPAAKGGTPPYTFIIQREDGTTVTAAEIAAGLPSGIYILHVTDANNCEAKDTILFTDVLSIAGYEQAAWVLGQSRPNPAKNTVVIPYTLPTAGQVTFEIYSVMGQLLHREMLTAPSGENKIEYNVSALPSGLYFYSMRCNNRQLSRKMIIQK